MHNTYILAYIHTHTYIHIYIRIDIHTYPVLGLLISIGLHNLHIYIYIHNCITKKMGERGVAQLVVRSTMSWCVVGSSPGGAEHFGPPPPSAPRLGNQRPWYVQLCLCDCLGIILLKSPCHLLKKWRGLSPGGRFPPSFIHQVIIITGLNKLYNRMFSPWRWPICRLGGKLPLKQTINVY